MLDEPSGTLLARLLSARPVNNLGTSCEETAWQFLCPFIESAVHVVTRSLPRSRVSSSKIATSDRGIVRNLSRVARQRADYWDFRLKADELASERLFQYPAMMVPALQKQVVIAILHEHPDVQTFADPFVGSGTILALAMLNGRAFIGQDINPLSILIAKTRAFSLNYSDLAKAVKRITEAACADRSRGYSVRFRKQSKWFTKGACIGLSRLRRAILREENLDTRRFLWVCLAETVRLNSNSRTSTYKLHVRPATQRNATANGVLKSFGSIATRNIEIVTEFSSVLQRAGHLDATGCYNRPVAISYGDSAVRFRAPNWSDDGRVEVVITSPPYGDNRTTVPYGQAAWLPLQWIDTWDIAKGLPLDVASGAYDIDNRSLGGRRTRKLESRRSQIAEFGPEIARYSKSLAAISRDGSSRFVNFVYDLRRALKHAANRCRENGNIILTLGDRNIAGTVCPLSDICAELLGSFDLKEFFRITRRIPSKRMAGKNSHSATITQEHISIFRKLPLSGESK
jgi:hypothetical protein